MRIGGGWNWLKVSSVVGFGVNSMERRVLLPRNMSKNNLQHSKYCLCFYHQGLIGFVVIGGCSEDLKRHHSQMAEKTSLHSVTVKTSNCVKCVSVWFSQVSCFFRCYAIVSIASLRIRYQMHGKHFLLYFVP